MEQKIDLFTQIHKAIRALLFDTARLLQKADFGNEQEMDEVLNRLELVLEMLEEHALHEDRFIFPAVEAVFPGATLECEQEHRAYEKKIQCLQALMQQLKETTSSKARQGQSGIINRCYADFLAFQLVHMNHEEEQVLDVSQELLLPDALQAIRHQIQANSNVTNYSIWVQWRLSSLSMPELVSLFEQLRMVPMPVYQLFRQTAERVLAPARWQHLIALTAANESLTGHDDLESALTI